MKIPQKYKTDPFIISPFGDLFWADKRNVDKVRKAIQLQGNVIVLENNDDIRNFIDRVLNENE